MENSDRSELCSNRYLASVVIIELNVAYFAIPAGYGGEQKKASLHYHTLHRVVNVSIN